MTRLTGRRGYMVLRGAAGISGCGGLAGGSGGHGKGLGTV